MVSGSATRKSIFNLLSTVLKDGYEMILYFKNSIYFYSLVFSLQIHYSTVYFQ